jgi:glycosyltransferase involved in cell wall biosynthesis
MRNLYFGISLATYRIDYYNFLYEHCDFEIILPLVNPDFCNQEKMERECRFPIVRADIVKIGHRYVVKGLNDFLKKYTPEVVIVPEFSLNAIQLLVYRKLFSYKYKVISQCDDSLDMIKGNDFSLYHRISRKYLPRLFDSLILVNPRVRDWYQSHFGKGVWFPIIADEVNLRRKLQNVLGRSAELKADYGLENTNVILFVGRLLNLKNVQMLIQTYSRLKYKSRLVIVGDGGEMKNLKLLDSELRTNVIFTGRLEAERLYPWYNVANIFCLPSYLEPFGAVVNEALVAGCYTVVSNHAGSACLIQENVNGYVFDPEDENDLYSCLLKAMEQPVNTNEYGLKSNLMNISFGKALEMVLPELGLHCN